MTSKKHVTFKILLCLVFTDIMETFAQFCFKKSAVFAAGAGVSSLSDILLLLKAVLPSAFLWLGLVSVLVIFITWSTILSKIDLSVAVPVASFSYILIPLASHIFLHEQISSLRWYGIFCILLGVILVSLSTRRREEHA